MQGKSFGQALGSGLKSGVMGGITGGLIGGISVGIDAAIDGRNFWNGGLNTPEKLEILYKQALEKGIINPEKGAVGKVEVGSSPDLANCNPGDIIKYDETMLINEMKIEKIGYSNNDLVFSRRLVRRIWRGKAPLEAINHEVLHANDYFNASWWNEPNASELILHSNKLTKWMELRALNINIQRSGWKVFKNYNQFWLNK